MEKILKLHKNENDPFKMYDARLESVTSYLHTICTDDNKSAEFYRYQALTYLIIAQHMLELLADCYIPEEKEMLK